MDRVALSTDLFKPPFAKCCFCNKTFKALSYDQRKL